MAMNHGSTDEPTREWPVRAMDSQQEPAIPDDVIWPPDAEKPDKAIPKDSVGAERLPANDDAESTKVEKRPAPSAKVETRKAPAKKAAAKKAAAKKSTGTTTTKRSGSRRR